MAAQGREDIGELACGLSEGFEQVFDDTETPFEGRLLRWGTFGAWSVVGMHRVVGGLAQVGEQWFALVGDELRIGLVGDGTADGVDDHLGGFAGLDGEGLSGLSVTVARVHCSGDLEVDTEEIPVGGVGDGLDAW